MFNYFSQNRQLRARHLEEPISHQRSDGVEIIHTAIGNAVTVRPVRHIQIWILLQCALLFFLKHSLQFRRNWLILNAIEMGS